jgi:hypothetical protein
VQEKQKEMKMEEIRRSWSGRAGEGETRGNKESRNMLVNMKDE